MKKTIRNASDLVDQKLDEIRSAREEERLVRRRRRIEKWYKSLPPEKQKPLTASETKKLIAEGLVEKGGGLTPAGELRLLQLETLEWMKQHPQPRRRRGIKEVRHES